MRKTPMNENLNPLHPRNRHVGTKPVPGAGGMKSEITWIGWTVLALCTGGLALLFLPFPEKG